MSNINKLNLVSEIIFTFIYAYDECIHIIHLSVSSILSYKLSILHILKKTVASEGQSATLSYVHKQKYKDYW